MSIGKRIRTARKRLPGMTQKDIAEHFGITVQAVSAWERDETKDLSRDRIEKLAKFLQVTRDWLEGKTAELPPLKDNFILHFESLTSEQQIMVRATVEALRLQNTKRRRPDTGRQ